MTRYAVVGDPITHSKSPQIHALFAEQTGEAVAFDKHRVAAADFSTFLDSFFSEGGAGLNITLPHKEAAYALADQTSQRARLAKAANTLWIDEFGRRCADNTDGAGIVRDLAVNNGIDLAGKRLLMLGAGGAARGALAALVETQLSNITVLNRTLSRAEAVKNDFSAAYGLSVGDYSTPPANRYDVLVNATSMSLAGEVPAIGPAVLGENCCCYDMMYDEEPTAFMRWATANGAGLVLDGLGMLVEQAAESFLIWRGVRPQTRAVIEKLRR